MQASRETNSTPPHAVIFQMLMGGWTLKVLAEVTRLGVPDVLHQYGPLTSAEVIQRGAIRADPRALHRALQACAALGVFGEDPEGRFSLTPISEVLTRDTPGSLKRLTELHGGLLWKVWTGLSEGLATGQPQACAQLGMEMFDYLTAHPAAMEEFAEAMKANSFNVNRGLLAHYDFSGIRKIIDVGGGFGHLAIALLENYEQLRGVVLDLPDVIAAARERLPVTNPSLAERLEYVAGDMFQSVPSADAYILKMIIHDWDDARCVAILRNCCSQLEDHGRVLCIDAVLPPLGDTSDAPGKLLDVNMLLVLPGKERTQAEWEQLYHDAGLEVRAITPIPDTYGTCIVEGRKR
jgi:ubiquinone/menaquinone biosynthesis C-methylase UbiE